MDEYIVGLNGLWVQDFVSEVGAWSFTLSPSRDTAKRYAGKEAAQSVVSNIGWYGLPMVVELANG